MKLNSQPQLNVIELYKWMPDNDPKFVPHGEDTSSWSKLPYFAVVDKNAGDAHFSFEIVSFNARLLRRRRLHC